MSAQRRSESPDVAAGKPGPPAVVCPESPTRSFDSSTVYARCGAIKDCRQTGAIEKQQIAVVAGDRDDKKTQREGQRANKKRSHGNVCGPSSPDQKKYQTRGNDCVAKMR